MSQIKLKEKSTIEIVWKTTPYDYSNSVERDIIEKMSIKYGIPKEKIKVLPNFVVKGSQNNEISLKDDVIGDIQNPLFQQGLFEEYLKTNNVENYDINELYKIDNQINSQIDYDEFEKHRSYTIKWLKWDNFLSYGGGNMFDFTDLEGLVLLNGEPANQSGKTTFAIDLVHFVFFGKTSKTDKQEDIFNLYLPEATQVVGEICLTIDGSDYVIKRVLNRPSLAKRTDKSKTTSSVEYFKVVGDNRIELSEYSEKEDQVGDSVSSTNKIIKEAIGNEADFDLVICATSKNLDDLIDKKDTERGRIIARWIGLLPLEKKDELGRSMFNSSIKPSLSLNQYNRETLLNENNQFKSNNETLNEENERYIKENEILEREIGVLDGQIKTFISLKKEIDSNLLKVDSTTLNTKLQNIITQGNAKKDELAALEKKLKEIGDVTFSDSELDELTNKGFKLQTDLNNVKSLISQYQSSIKNLKTSESCQACGRKYDNVDNSGKIAEFEGLLTEQENKIPKLETDINENSKLISELKVKREQYNEKSKLELKISSIKLTVESLRADYKETSTTLNEYNKNNEAIDNNNKLDIEIRNGEIRLNGLRNTKQTNLSYITNNKNKIANNDESIAKNLKIMVKLDSDEKILRNWTIYLDIVGKNGISKMVMRKALPIINANLKRLLNDVCDFSVELEINPKNEVTFLIVRDGSRSNLSGGSGFELTASALALRTVLASMSTLPKPSLIVFDELLGRVAKENYDNMHNLYKKILENYKCILQISHLEEIKDWHSQIVTVKKQDNISYLNTTKNNSIKIA